MEDFAEDAELLGRLRKWLDQEALVVTKVAKDKETDPEAQRYRDYFRYDEPLCRVPSHRALAIFRARKEGFVDGFLGMATADSDERHPLTDDPTQRGQAFVMERGDRKNNQRPGPPGTHQSTIPGPTTAVNAPGEPRSSQPFRPVSRLHPRPLPTSPMSRSSPAAPPAQLPLELQFHLPRR